MTPSDSKPRFRQIVDGLRQQISEGRLSVHAALPSERSLAEEFDVSRMTARRALEALEAEGLAYGKDRQGRFVSPERINYDVSSMEDFVSRSHTTGSGLIVELLSSKSLGATGKILEKLRISKNEKTYENVRLFHRDDHAVFLETETVIAERCAGLIPDAKVLSTKELQEVRYSPLGHTADTVIRMRPIATNEAGFLGVTSGQLGIEQTQIVMDSSGVPFCFCQQIWRGELAQFSATAMLRQSPK
jgi:DNA-binding GntR family transcriptional regulator